MSGEERRELLARRLEEATSPMKGSELAKMAGVSRQVIVQDIAILRTGGMEIVSTNRGYIAPSSSDAGRSSSPGGQSRPTRLLKVWHTEEQTEQELTTIVDLGGWVDDVMVNHRSYGTISADLGIKCRRDVKRFLDDLESGKSSPLMQITSGYHFHHVSAETEEDLDEIEATLAEMGFLVEFSEYERTAFLGKH